ncbi:ATP-binding cassette subfamily C protein [Streptomyces aurantiacus]|uniref:ATP-binding cassette domain-containing protein n=1 Tax=Streptomyces aurantiacus TaxID=47760 RepID=UPI0027928E61|nr:ABC transporter ATP-binding protein [Streptomyces aurantiacus]MDQ0772521.1 ATP-binding cassette subfamily C protein [Streptomyces aurantiacus]
MSGNRVYRRGLRFLRDRWRVVARLAAWSVLESGQTFLTGFALARAVDAGFLAGRAAVGLGWLGAAAVAVVAGAYGTGRVYLAVAALVEPLRDRLVRDVVDRGVRDADRGALSRLTQQVEIARDTFAGIVMVSRSFVFTAVGALVGLFSLAPLLLLVVVPPLAASLVLFALTLRPLTRRQEAFLVADEELATQLGAVCPGLRDITAAGAEEQVTADALERIGAEQRAARSLARWGVLRVVSLTIGGQLPLVLLLATAPWLLAHGVTAGALVGALSYVGQSLLPALQNLIHGLGTSGSRLAVVLRRLSPGDPTDPDVRDVRDIADVRGTADDAREPAAARASETATGTPAPAPASSTAPAARPSPQAAVPLSHVTLSHVTFAYGPASEPVIEDLDLSIPHGTHLAVVGPSGIGKSTLAALMAGLLQPTGGSVDVHVDVQQVPGARPTERHHVLIPQEAYVYTGTLAENLGHLRAGVVPEAELLAAAADVGLTALLDRLGGPTAEVAPGTLSAGERQLIALTRAHLTHAPLVLLDEATCHLDPAAEARAERAFARRGGTLVVVAHRVSSALRADRVLVMDGPRTAYGDHTELLERSPLYRDLVGAWSGPSQPALSLRDPDGVDAVAGAGLARDGRHVVPHGPVGQMETAGDLRDGGAVGGE